MSPLSSDTLFHFTGTRENLLSILRQTFRPNYCLEKLPFGEGDANGTPMVCFCDIPLSQTIAHMKRYGNYAIGLTKEWGRKNHVTPVLYAHSNAPFAPSMARLMERALQVGKGPIDKAMWNDLTCLLHFMKPYTGEENGQQIRYYDEREWRWVPALSEPELRYGIDPSEFVDGRPPSIATQRLHEAISLSFEPKDIRYIIVEKEAEILEVARAVRQIKSRFDPDQQELLIARLISAEHIRADF